MTDHLVDGIEILVWSHRLGLSAFAASFVFELEYDEYGRATIDAHRTRLVDFPDGVDRYQALDGPAKARILKAALAGREDYRGFAPGSWEQYLVRVHEPDLDEVKFLRIVTQFVHAWRRRRDSSG